MLSIRNGEALARGLRSDIDHRLRRLLRLRCEQLAGDIAGQAHVIVVEAGDQPAALEQCLSFSVFQNAADGSHFGEPGFTPGWEWIENHGFCFELVFIFDDSGFAHVVLVEKAEGVDPQLLELCRAYAEPAGALP